MTRPSDWPATAERLQLLAAACAVTGLDHLPIVSRENAAPFVADLRVTLSYIAELEAALTTMAALVRVKYGNLDPDANAALATAAALQRGADHA